MDPMQLLELEREQGSRAAGEDGEGGDERSLGDPEPEDVEDEPPEATHEELEAQLFRDAAAKRRRMRRETIEERFEGDGNGEEDDPSVPATVEDAFWANSGVPIEPFNLRRERREGFFLPDGTYVQNDDTVRDAWLENVDQQPLDPDWVKRVTTRGSVKMASNGRGAGPSSGAAAHVARGDGDAGAAADVGELRKRVARDLLSGESPLEALRRLGGTQEHGKRWQRMLREARATGLEPQVDKKWGQSWVPEGQRRAFDELTAAVSDLVNATGDAGVYLRNQQWFDPADAARVPGGGGESSISPSRKVSAAAVAEDALDMFG